MDLPEEEEPEGAPEWLMTFSDLVSLLVTLFIMMLTFTTQETDQLNKVLDMVRSGFGIIGPDMKNKPDFMDAQPQPTQRLQGVTRPDPDARVDLENRINELEGFVLEDSRLDEGLRIVPSVVNCFAPGEDRPTVELETEVRRLARRLKLHKERRFVIEGHCDPTTDRRNALGGLEELGMARARRIARIMGLEGVQLVQLSITSRGGRKPRGSTATVEGQAANRRIEILVLPVTGDSGG